MAKSQLEKLKEYRDFYSGAFDSGKSDLFTDNWNRAVNELGYGMAYKNKDKLPTSAVASMDDAVLNQMIKNGVYLGEDGVLRGEKSTSKVDDLVGVKATDNAIKQKSVNKNYQPVGRTTSAKEEQLTGDTTSQAYKDAWANITADKMYTPEQTNPSGLTVNGNKMPEISDAAIEQTVEEIAKTIPEFTDPTAERIPAEVTYDNYTPVDAVSNGLNYNQYIPNENVTRSVNYDQYNPQTKVNSSVNYDKYSPMDIQKGKIYEYNPLTYNGFQSQGNSPVAGVTQDVYDRAMAEYRSSAAVTEADAYLSRLRQQLESGKTSRTDELNNLIDNYKNRGSFEYDPNSDMLYQNYLTAMQNAGQTAMKDTMGQAAALTGGYGSSYATAAANGAYNNYLQTANDNLVNFYNMAMDRYKLDQDRDLQAIDLTRLQDENEYSRAEANYLRNKDYADSLYNREYTQYLNAVNQAMQTASMMQNDYWNAENLKSSIDMANATNQLNYDKLNSATEEAYQDRLMAENHYATDDAFRKAEAERAQNNWAETFLQSERQYANDDAFRKAEANRAQNNWAESYLQSERQYANDDAFRRTEAEREQSNWEQSYNQSERQYAANDAYRKSESAREQSNWETEFAYQKAIDEYNREMAQNTSSGESAKPYGGLSASQINGLYTDALEVWRSAPTDAEAERALAEFVYGLKGLSVEEQKDIADYVETYGNTEITLTEDSWLTWLWNKYTADDEELGYKELEKRYKGTDVWDKLKKLKQGESITVRR